MSRLEYTYSPESLAVNLGGGVSPIPPCQLVFIRYENGQDRARCYNVCHNSFNESGLALHIVMRRFVTKSRKDKP